MENLKQELENRGYFITPQLEYQIKAVLNNKPVKGAFIEGPPGSGKSMLVQYLAEVMGYDFIVFQCFPGTREDDLIMKLLPSEKTKSGVTLADGPVMEAVKRSHEHKVILLLDEWDKTRPSADSFMLDFLQTGRINFAGKKAVANFKNLIIFFTLNYERELSEPLLRRMPILRLQNPHPEIVRKALEFSHKNNPYIDTAVGLYVATLAANLPKPATIQELRQMLDAIEVTNGHVDFGSLVYQFITKNMENHMLLQQVLNNADNININLEEPLMKADFNQINKFGQIAKELEPRKIEELQIDYEKGKEMDVEYFENTGGFIVYSERAYDMMARIKFQPNEDPYTLADIAYIEGPYIVLKQPLPAKALLDDDIFNKLSKMDIPMGKLVFEANIKMNDVMEKLKNNPDVYIVKFSKNEIILKYPPDEKMYNYKARVTPNKIEIISMVDKHSLYITRSFIANILI